MDQAADLRELWDEFEERKTPESKFANALDRVQPFLHNYFTRGEKPACAPPAYLIE